MPAPVAVKPKQIILSQAVIDSVADLPRDYLGDVLYEPKLKAARKCDPLTGRPPRYPYSTTPRPLPLDMIKDKANSILTVKVSKVFLQPAAREEITHRRALWGTDIYTDDSDVVAACIHGGWIRGEWPDDVDVDLLGLAEQADTTGSGSARETTGGRKRGAAAAAASAAAAAAAAAAAEARNKPSPDLLTAPLKTGPMDIPPDKDLHVTLLILPTLLKYSATTRFGIRSREWGGLPHEQHQPHDGMSFKVLKIRWVTNGAGAQSRLRGKARRERMRQAMREVDLASSVGKNELPQISAPLTFAIGTTGIGAGAGAGAGIGGGDAPSSSAAKATNGSDGDKENRPGSAKWADTAAAAAAAAAADPNINGNKEVVSVSDNNKTDASAGDGPILSDKDATTVTNASEAPTTAVEDPDTTMTDVGMDD